MVLGVLAVSEPLGNLQFQENSSSEPSPLPDHKDSLKNHYYWSSHAGISRTAQASAAHLFKMGIFDKLPSLPTFPEIPDKPDLRTFQRSTATVLYIYFLCKLLLSLISSHIFNPLFPYGFGNGLEDIFLTTLILIPAMLMEALSGLIGYNIFRCEAEQEAHHELSRRYRRYLMTMVILEILCIFYKALIFGAGDYAFVHIPITTVIVTVGTVILNLSEVEVTQSIVVEKIVAPQLEEVKKTSLPMMMNGMVKIFDTGSSDTVHTKM